MGYKRWEEISVPKVALLERGEKASKFAVPETVMPGGYTFYIPNVFIKDEENSTKYKLFLPADFRISAHSERISGTYSPTPSALAAILENSIPEEYLIQTTLESSNQKENKTWKHYIVPKEAMAFRYENACIFKMPRNGKYSGFIYKVPSRMVKEEGEDFKVLLPSGYNIHLSIKNPDGTTKELFISRDIFLDEINSSKSPDYSIKVKNNDWKEKEKNINENIPEDFKKKDRWIALKVFKDKTGKKRKLPIDCNKVGKISPARSDDPSTWTSLEKAIRFAKESGCAGIAYALTGEDKLCCVDIDHCIEKGSYSELAKEVLALSTGTYIEKSISGKGIHIFFKTEGLPVRSFSRDGTLEYYEKAHFIGLTGNMISKDNNLLWIESSPVHNFVLNRCDLRPKTRSAGKGIKGLSALSDREVVERASASKDKDFARLYLGEDLRGNKSNSDMSLMNRLAFWCSGDREQMLRIFASSGLFRPEKSPDYYEYTATKAIESVGERYNASHTFLKETNKQIKEDSYGKEKSI